MSDEPVAGMLLAGVFIVSGGALTAIAAESLGILTEAQLVQAASVVGLCLGLAVVAFGLYGLSVELREVTADE